MMQKSHGQQIRELVNAKEAREELGVSERAFYLLRAHPQFPKAICFGPRSLRWSRRELIEFATTVLPRKATAAEPTQFATARAARAAKTSARQAA